METAAGSAPEGDAAILQAVMLSAVADSPGSFSRTLDEVKAAPADYWGNEIRTGKWAVAEHGGVPIGVAVSKLPDPRLDREDPETARYIESVWVDPDLRRSRLGEGLIKYLLAAEYLENRHIEEFLLWVYPDNEPALRLYEYLGFDQTGEEHREPAAEIKYRLEFDPERHTTLDLTANPSARSGQLPRGVAYRVLGQADGRQRLRDT